MKQTIDSLLKTSPHLLIVDDDISQLREMVGWLSARPGKLYQARSSEQAMQILKRHPISAVITDWQLPEMSGLELIRHLRSQQFNGPLLLCTGLMLSAEHLMQAFEAGAHDYLSKPLNGVELNARLDNALDLHAQREALRLLSQSQERFIQFLASALGEDLHHLTQLQRLEPNPRLEKALAGAMAQNFQKLMAWARYRLALKTVQMHHFELKTLFQGLAQSFADDWHRLLLRGGKDLTLYSEPELLQRILRHLLENAFRHSTGQVMLQASETESEIQISVRSTGQLSEGQLEALLQPEHQGLGLMICQDLLALLNSCLQVRRGRNGDHIFYFALRLH